MKSYCELLFVVNSKNFVITPTQYLKHYVVYVVRTQTILHIRR